MIDMLNKVRHLIEFKSEDDFYYLQILQRKKENPQLGSNSRVIKNYYIKNLEYLDNKYEEIKELCVQFNARAMLRLNKRSFKKVAFKTMVNVANSMSNGEYAFVNKSYDRACGNGHNDPNKKWILDIDNPYTSDWLERVKEKIYSFEPVGEKIIAELPTKNGVHLITSPFNLKTFKEDFPEIDVHKDNPINLYIP